MAAAVSAHRARTCDLLNSATEDVVTLGRPRMRGKLVARPLTQSQFSSRLLVERSGMYGRYTVSEKWLRQLVDSR